MDTSIMLSVTSGTTFPGKALRCSKESKSGLAAIKSKLLRLTNCNSNSTPRLSADDCLNASSGMSVSPPYLHLMSEYQSSLCEQWPQNLHN
ncbi:hypothetical protein PSEUDO8AS_90071 [Pseudomonas sp. 8AS]|nr:hypothetical protein PSEUDO8AS_90071 [Pseudomonas sp. 8AS]